MMMLLSRMVNFPQNCLKNKLIFHVSKHGSTSKAASQPPKSVTPDLSALCKLFEAKITPNIVKYVEAIFLFIITGDEAGKWYLDLKTGKGSCGKGEPQHPPDVIFTLDSKNFIELITGKTTPARAYLSGQIKIAGSIQKAIKLDRLLASLRKKLVPK